MTRDEIANRVMFTLELQDDTTFSESGYIQDLIYEAILDISTRTAPFARVINMTTTPNTQTHDMGSTILSLVDIFDPQGKLYRYAVDDIEEAQRQGMRGFCYRAPLLWISPISSVPVPLRAFGVFRPQKMSGGTQSPSHEDYGGLAEEFHPTIITYCLWHGGEYMQHEASGNGEKWRVQYEGQNTEGGELAKIRRILHKRATPSGTRKRNPVRTVGSVPDASYYIGG